MALTVSAGVAAICGAAMAVIITQLVAIDLLPRANRLPLISGTVILLFFLSAFVNLQRHFNILSMLRGAPGRKLQASGPEQMMASMAAKNKPAFTQEFEFDQVEIKQAAEPSGLEDMPEEEVPTDLDADPDADVGFGAESEKPEDKSTVEPEDKPAAEPEEKKEVQK